jgi:wyosine [tRNA(Phe)-imidazoG37] synthetase (radical SAM superfamily)
LKVDRAVIEINGGCNYTCSMCPQTDTVTGKHGARGKNWLKKMPLDMFEDVVAECTEAGLNVVNLEGSGEPTLNRNLPEYIAIVKKYGAKAFCFSNGMRMKDRRFMKEVVDAGVDFFRFSIIGYNEELYKKWMNSPFYNLALSNMKAMNEYVAESGSDATIASYHLVLDNDNIDYEVEQYKKIVETAGVSTEIWKMHNWAGVYKPEYEREGKIKTCGRPFSPDLVIRAGGLDGKRGAVHPCCQVLGRDDEAVLGHFQDNTLAEIVKGDAYSQLREDHRTGNFPDFCKSCDFLIDDPETLVYTNHKRDLYKMHGTNFDLNDYR